MKWNTLSEGEIGEVFWQLCCCVCGLSAISWQGPLSDLAWFPRDIYDDQKARKLIAEVRQGACYNSSFVDPETFVFCADCQYKIRKK